MVRYRIGMAFLAVALMSFVGASRGKAPEERPIYKTPQELREACWRFLASEEELWEKARAEDPRLPEHPPKVVKPPDLGDTGKRDFILGYLDSEDPEMRDAALDILVELWRLRRYIRASAFDRYLDRQYPIGVRVIALAYTWRGRRGEDEVLIPRRDRLEQNWDVWAEVWNDIVEYPVSPPYLGVLCESTESGPWEELAELTKPENRPVMVERLLSAASSSDVASDRKHLIRTALRFPDDIVVGELLKWYARTASVGARAALLKELRTARYWKRAWFGPVLELASKDWDLELAEKARTLLADSGR